MIWYVNLAAGWGFGPLETGHPILSDDDMGL